MGGFGILRIPEWIVKFAYLNLLWICFTLLGFLVLGLFPATVAMFAVCRKWLLGEMDINVTKTFWQIYKIEFWKSNLLGLILGGIGFALSIYQQILPPVAGVSTFLLFVTLLYLILLVYSFPIYVHYDIPVLHVLKNALFTMVIAPWSNVMILAGGTILFFLFTSFPGLLFIFGPSVSAFLVMWSATLSFNYVERKQVQSVI